MLCAFLMTHKNWFYMCSTFKGHESCHLQVSSYLWAVLYITFITCNHYLMISSACHQACWYTSVTSLLPILHMYVTCNRPQQVFPRGLPKILNYHAVKVMVYRQGLPGTFISIQSSNDYGFWFIILYIMHCHWNSWFYPCTASGHTFHYHSIITAIDKQ